MFQQEKPGTKYKRDRDQSSGPEMTGPETFSDYCTVYTVLLYSVHSTTVQCTLYTVPLYTTMYTVLLYSVHSIPQISCDYTQSLDLD